MPDLTTKLSNQPVYPNPLMTDCPVETSQSIYLVNQSTGFCMIETFFKVKVGSRSVQGS